MRTLSVTVTDGTGNSRTTDGRTLRLYDAWIQASGLMTCMALGAYFSLHETAQNAGPVLVGLAVALATAAIMIPAGEARYWTVPTVKMLVWMSAGLLAAGLLAQMDGILPGLGDSWLQAQHATLLVATWTSMAVLAGLTWYDPRDVRNVERTWPRGEHRRS